MKELWLSLPDVTIWESLVLNWSGKIGSSQTISFIVFPGQNDQNRNSPPSPFERLAECNTEITKFYNITKDKKNHQKFSQTPFTLGIEISQQDIKRKIINFQCDIVNLDKKEIIPNFSPFEFACKSSQNRQIQTLY